VKTIGIDLWGGQLRGVPNRATVMRPVPRVVRRSCRDLFIGAYERVADRCRAVDEPGLAMIAVHDGSGRAAGLVTLRARPGRHVAAIVGRHDHCDLFLTGSEDLALRHLAIVVEPVTSWRRGAKPGYRVYDLRTTHGFQDEEGRNLRGLRAEGPAVIRCAGHTLFLLPLGDPSD